MGDTEASQQKREHEYARLMKRGINFPPIKVFGKRHTSDTYQVFDGHPLPFSFISISAIGIFFVSVKKPSLQRTISSSTLKPSLFLKKLQVL